MQDFFIGHESRHSLNTSAQAPGQPTTGTPRHQTPTIPTHKKTATTQLSEITVNYEMCGIRESAWL
jgi:hypothetical protein